MYSKVQVHDTMCSAKATPHMSSWISHLLQKSLKQEQFQLIALLAVGV